MDGIKNSPPLLLLIFAAVYRGTRVRDVASNRNCHEILTSHGKEENARRVVVLSIKDLSAGFYLNGRVAESLGSHFLVFSDLVPLDEILEDSSQDRM